MGGREECLIGWEVEGKREEGGGRDGGREEGKCREDEGGGWEEGYENEGGREWDEGEGGGGWKEEEGRIAEIFDSMRVSISSRKSLKILLNSNETMLRIMELISEMIWEGEGRDDGEEGSI